MEFIGKLIDFVLHLDVHLNALIATYQLWTYLILFVVIFCETGLVVTPFLPGDSLLFATGALAAAPASPLRVHCQPNQRPGSRYPSRCQRRTSSTR